MLAPPETISYFQVEKSMKNIDLVVQEREVALRLLQTGHEKPVPGEWRHDFLGRTFWYGKELFLLSEFLWYISSTRKSLSSQERMHLLYSKKLLFWLDAPSVVFFLSYWVFFHVFEVFCCFFGVSFYVEIIVAKQQTVYY